MGKGVAAIVAGVLLIACAILSDCGKVSRSVPRSGDARSATPAAARVDGAI